MKLNLARKMFNVGFRLNIKYRESFGEIPK